MKISWPVSVTARVCSNWADSDLSAVTAVQPSFSNFVLYLPTLIIGSIVNTYPGFSSMPVPALPKCKT